MYVLHIANKNYSSWSLRPWALLHALDIPFEESLHRFVDTGTQGFDDFSPNGRVPCLYDGDTVVWDSLAIVEYVAEHHPGVWPADPHARAFARSAAAEMHSGFQALRSHCPMSCGVRVALHELPPAVRADLARIDAIWHEGLSRFGGPFLAGRTFTALDAFYAPVVFRVQTYGLPLSEAARTYVAHMLAHPVLRAWYVQALAEHWRDAPHEDDIRSLGKVVEDLRAPA